MHIQCTFNMYSMFYNVLVIWLIQTYGLIDSHTQILEMLQHLKIFQTSLSMFEKEITGL